MLLNSDYSQMSAVSRTLPYASRLDVSGKQSVRASFSAANAQRQSLAHLLRAVAQAAWYVNGSATNAIQLLDMYARGPYPGALAGYQQNTTGISWLEDAWNHYSFLSFYPMCPAIPVDLFGYMTPVPLSTASSTVCVLNCGVLPWKFSRTYAAATRNATATSAPYQAFSMVFPGISAAAFQTNDHVAFDRDQFLQRYSRGIMPPSMLCSSSRQRTVTDISPHAACAVHVCMS